MLEETTVRLELPLLQPGQAQKEMFHNEALTRIDAVLAGCVIDDGIDTPPVAPTAGECWIIGPAPVGAWTGQADALAVWTIGGWRFVAPVEGLTMWHAGRATPARYLAGGWRFGEMRGSRLMIDGVDVVGPRAGAIANPTGEGSIDEPARVAIGAILNALRGHGLIAN